jgi:hypothetical protein
MKLSWFLILGVFFFSLNLCYSSISSLIAQTSKTILAPKKILPTTTAVMPYQNLNLFQRIYNAIPILSPIDYVSSQKNKPRTDLDTFQNLNCSIKEIRRLDFNLPLLSKIIRAYQESTPDILHGIMFCIINKNEGENTNVHIWDDGLEQSNPFLFSLQLKNEALSNDYSYHGTEVATLLLCNTKIQPRMYKNIPPDLYEMCTQPQIINVSHAPIFARRNDLINLTHGISSESQELLKHRHLLILSSGNWGIELMPNGVYVNWTKEQLALPIYSRPSNVLPKGDFLENAGAKFLKSLILTGSMTYYGLPCSFSNKPGNSKTIQSRFIYAVGENITTLTKDNEIKKVSGTSYSAPLVSKTAALLREAHPGFSLEEIADILLASTKKTWVIDIPGSSVSVHILENAQTSISMSIHQDRLHIFCPFNPCIWGSGILDAISAFTLAKLYAEERTNLMDLRKKINFDPIFNPYLNSSIHLTSQSFDWNNTETWSLAVLPLHQLGILEQLPVLRSHLYRINDFKALWDTYNYSGADTVSFLEFLESCNLSRQATDLLHHALQKSNCPYDIYKISVYAHKKEFKKEIIEAFKRVLNDNIANQHLFSLLYQELLYCWYPDQKFKLRQ